MRFLSFAYFTTENSLSTVDVQERWPPDRLRISPATGTCFGVRSKHHGTQRRRQSCQWSSSIRLAAVRVTQGLVLAPDNLNLLDAEGVVETLSVALQIYGEVAGKNAGQADGVKHREQRRYRPRFLRSAQQRRR
eukprot:IDg7727t1